MQGRAFGEDDAGEIYVVALEGVVSRLTGAGGGGVVCAPTISGSELIVSRAGETAAISVTAPAGCLWTATSTADWITFPSGASGAGSGTLSVSVAPRSGWLLPRVGFVVIAGMAAWATGQAVAQHWRPYWQVVALCCLLGLVDRFLHWGLFLDYPLNVYKGDIFSLQYYLVDTAVLLLMGSLGYRVTRTKQMTSQYPWLYRRTSPFTWEERKQESA